MASEYIPPRVWTMDSENAGARFERELPVGSHPIQLYSMGTPKLAKVTSSVPALLR